MQIMHYIKWGFESRLKPFCKYAYLRRNYIKWGFESRLKPNSSGVIYDSIISNGDLKVG